MKPVVQYRYAAVSLTEPLQYTSLSQTVAQNLHICGNRECDVAFTLYNRVDSGIKYTLKHTHATVL